jgi:tetratricopeptide (TPR) repeat protein
VASICRRLDGIPLAIELAAARLRALTVQQISERLDARFRLLTGGSRTALPRQRTLAAMMDWSHDLLEPDEQMLFRRVAVFHRGFTLAAAEEVCGDDELDPLDVVDHLTRLVEVSLVVPGRQGDERYRLLETVRQYALDRLLGSGEADAVRRRHAEYFLTAGPKGRSGIPDGTWVDWFEFRDREYGNYMAALAWAVDSGQTDLAKGLVIQLGNYWPSAGALLEGDRWTSRVLAMSDREPDHEQMRVLTFAASNAAFLGRADEADLLAAEVESVARAIGDEAGLASALSIRTSLAEQFGNLCDAEGMAREALAIFTRLEDPRTSDRARNLAWNLTEQGRYDEARSILDGLEGQPGVALGSGADLTRRTFLALLAHHEGRYEDALEIMTDLSSDLPELFRAGLAETGAFQASILFAMGRTDEARPLCEAAVATARENGNRQDEAHGLVLLARMDLIQGPMVAAGERLSEALQILELIPHRRIAASTGLTAAAFEAMRERQRQAALLLSAADVVADGMGLAYSAPDAAWREEQVVARLPAIGPSRFGASDALELILGWEM